MGFSFALTPIAKKKGKTFSKAYTRLARSDQTNGLGTKAITINSAAAHARENVCALIEGKIMRISLIMSRFPLVRLFYIFFFYAKENIERSAFVENLGLSKLKVMCRGGVCYRKQFKKLMQ